MLVAPSTSISACFNVLLGQLLVELVFDLADDLLEHILDGEQAGHRAEFIHHQRHVQVPLAKLLEHLHERLGFGHDQRLAHDVRQMRKAARDGRDESCHAALVPDAQHVLEEHGADQLLRLVLPIPEGANAGSRPWF